MEELCEAEVLWPEMRGRAVETYFVTDATCNLKGARNNKTAAVDIPTTRRRKDQESGGNDEFGSYKTEMVPPHILASRRRASASVAYSLCSGEGRTLKGRDLRYVRDSVLRMTGFIEG